eukprot:TRINITY_DN14878_c0_g1_i1.p1 TRINITY_DN14878_c0_g1~~TRINITY_DN14878_c0_g1_i1.p1  ORF type:complete len:419 (-),score=88.46 TRINITY_DN14878_c0_g1_i1:35-1291(-)
MAAILNAAAKMADKVLGSAPTSTPMQPNVDPNIKMNAIVWHSREDVRYVEKPKPIITDSTDIILRITATTICGSDLHLYTNAMLDMHDGDILGHEFMGIIEDAGSEVKNLKVGQRVVVAFGIACGKCDYCKREEFTACDTTNPSKLIESVYGHRPAALYGYSHLTGGVPGGQSEYVRVPFADVNCLVIPEDVPDEKALYLSDVVPTAYHGTELAKVKEGSTVAIWGLGPIGLMAARWCQIRKASRIIGIECVPERIELARKHLGPSVEIVDFSKDNTIQKVLELVPGGVDCAIECAGFEYATSLIHKVERALMLETDTADIFSEMFTCVRKFGRVSIIGVYSGTANHFPVGAMMEKDLIIKGGQSPTQKYWLMCLEKIRSGELDPTFIITHRAQLKDAPTLYQRFHKDKDVIKCFLRP